MGDSGMAVITDNRPRPSSLISFFSTLSAVIFPFLLSVFRLLHQTVVKIVRWETVIMLRLAVMELTPFDCLYVSSYLHVTWPRWAKKHCHAVCPLVWCLLKECVDVNSKDVRRLNISEEYTLLFKVNEREAERLQETTIKYIPPSSDSVWYI